MKTILLTLLSLLNLVICLGQRKIYSFKSKITTGLSPLEEVKFENRKIGFLDKDIKVHNNVFYGHINFDSPIIINRRMKFLKEKQLIGDSKIVLVFDSLSSAITEEDTIEILESPRNKLRLTGVIERVSSLSSNRYRIIIKQGISNQNMAAIIAKSNFTIKSHFKKLKRGQKVTVFGVKEAKNGTGIIIVQDLDILPPNYPMQLPK